MRELWISILPDSIALQGQFLGAFGVKETAWPVDCAVEIADMLRVDGWAIAGGDLYRKKEESFLPAHENWSCAIAASEAWESYVARSSIAARRFFLRFSEPDCWTTIVASSKPDTQQLASSHVR